MPRTIRRARWLAALAEALDEAHRLTLQLGEWRDDDHESVALRSRLKAAMAEVEALRRGPTAAATAIDAKPSGRRPPDRRPPRKDA